MTDVARLGFEVNTRQLKSASSELDKLAITGKRTEKSTESLDKSFLGMNKALVASTASVYLLSKAYNSVLSIGMAYNKQIELSKSGIIALSVATQDKAIPVIERYAKAQAESIVTLKELQKINVQTPHTLDQTNKIYKAMYASMKNVGASTADLVEMTRSLSIASGAAGIEFNSLLAGVDGLASGTVLANSDLGRFLSSLGLTNKVLKESDDVVKTVTESLKDFKALGTITEATSNLDNAWSQLTGKMTEGTFEGAKTGLNSLSDIINNLNDEDIKNLQIGMNQFAIVGLESVGFISKAFIGLSSTISTTGTAIADVMLWMTEWDGDYEEMSKRLWKTQNQSLITNQKIVDGINNAIEATRNSIIESEREKKVLEEKHDINEKGLIKTTELTEKQIKAIKEQEKLESEMMKNAFSSGYEEYRLDAENKRYAALKIELEIIKEQAMIIRDRDERGIATAEANFAMSQADLNHLYEIGDLEKEQYDKKMALQEQYRDQVIYDYTYMGQVMSSMTDSMESNFASFFDYLDADALDFGALMKGILHDIYMDLIRNLVVKEATDGITNFISGLGGLTTSDYTSVADSISFAGYTPNATGNVYNSPSLSAHSNSIVSNPTPFYFAAGGVPNLGVMGEAGSEAIMPLTRTSGGDLGVKVQGTEMNISIINNTDTTATAQQDDQGNLTIILDAVADSINRGTGGIRPAIQNLMDGG